MTYANLWFVKNIYFFGSVIPRLRIEIDQLSRQYFQSDEYFYLSKISSTELCFYTEGYE